MRACMVRHFPVPRRYCFKVRPRLVLCSYIWNHISKSATDAQGYALDPEDMIVDVVCPDAHLQLTRRPPRSPLPGLAVTGTLEPQFTSSARGTGGGGGAGSAGGGRRAGSAAGDLSVFDFPEDSPPSTHSAAAEEIARRPRQRDEELEAELKRKEREREAKRSGPAAIRPPLEVPSAARPQKRPRHSDSPAHRDSERKKADELESGKSSAKGTTNKQKTKESSMSEKESLQSSTTDGQKTAHQPQRVGQEAHADESEAEETANGGAEMNRTDSSQGPTGEEEERSESSHDLESAELLEMQEAEGEEQEQEQEEEEEEEQAEKVEKKGLKRKTELEGDHDSADEHMESEGHEEVTGTVSLESAAETDKHALEPVGIADETQASIEEERAHSQEAAAHSEPKSRIEKRESGPDSVQDKSNRKVLKRKTKTHMDHHTGEGDNAAKSKRKRKNDESAKNKPDTKAVEKESSKTSEKPPEKAKQHRDTSKEKQPSMSSKEQVQKKASDGQKRKKSKEEKQTTGSTQVTSSSSETTKLSSPGVSTEGDKTALEHRSSPPEKTIPTVRRHDGSSSSDSSSSDSEGLGSALRTLSSKASSGSASVRAALGHTQKSAPSRLKSQQDSPLGPTSTLPSASGPTLASRPPTGALKLLPFSSVPQTKAKPPVKQL